MICKLSGKQDIPLCEDPCTSTVAVKEYWSENIFAAPSPLITIELAYALPKLFKVVVIDPPMEPCIWNDNVTRK